MLDKNTLDLIDRALGRFRIAGKNGGFHEIREPEELKTGIEGRIGGRELAENHPYLLPRSPWALFAYGAFPSKFLFAGSINDLARPRRLASDVPSIS